MFVFLTFLTVVTTQPSVYGYGVLTWGLIGRSVMQTTHLVTRLRIIRIQNYCSGDKFEKNEMGGECSAYGREERRIQGFGGEA